VIYIKGAENIPKNDVLAVKYLKKGNFPPHTSQIVEHCPQNASITGI